MDKNKLEKLRFPIAVVLSLLVLLVYSRYIGKNNKPVQPTAPSVAQTNERSVPSQFAKAPTHKNVVQQKSILSPAGISTLSNKNHQINFSTHNAAIISNFLLTKNEDAEKKSSKHKNLMHRFDLEAGASEFYHTGNLSFEEDLKWPPRTTRYQLINQNSDTLVFIGKSGDAQSLQVKKTYVLKDHHLDLTISLKNNRGSEYRSHYFLINGSSIGSPLNPDETTSFDIDSLSYTTLDDDNNTILTPGFMSMFSGSKKNYERVEEYSKWIGLDSRFYMRILKPETPIYASEFFRPILLGQTNFISSYRVPFDLSPNQEVKNNFKFYFLPKNRNLLNQIKKETGDKFYHVFRQFDFMKILSDFMYMVIMFLNDFFHNFGVSIIAMTFLLKLATYPLTQKSYVSMQKMQSLSPRMAEIKRKYKDNPQKANMEVVAMYKKEKVNPAMGCLPMMIPIPIFFALYVLFQNMVELNHSSFLWIDNLALPDKLISFEKSYPFMGKNFNLLPLLMSGSQFIQSALTPQTATTDQAAAQAKLMKYFFPILFFFICWGLPSGLVLYWFVQNVFSIFQTLLTRKKAIT